MSSCNWSTGLVEGLCVLVNGTQVLMLKTSLTHWWTTMFLGEILTETFEQKALETTTTTRYTVVHSANPEVMQHPKERIA